MEYFLGLQRWIAFQLLVALAQAHERNVCHGDLKTENVLLTSSCWLFLVDFAPYKPAHLPADNPVGTLLYRAQYTITVPTLYIELRYGVQIRNIVVHVLRSAGEWVQADYSYFYDAGGRRRCYLAPERFYESDSDTAQLAQEPLRWSMVALIL
jgi:phosphoinositide-3-kinase, regulatory subunit 4